MPYDDGGAPRRCLPDCRRAKAPLGRGAALGGTGPVHEVDVSPWETEFYILSKDPLSRRGSPFVGVRCDC